MNRDTDMAHTVHPLSEDAREAFLTGRVLACVSARDLEAFFDTNPDLRDRAQQWTIAAGPRSTSWCCAQDQHAFFHRVAQDPELREEALTEGVLLGQAEIAQLLGWDARKVGVYASRPGFPAPVATLRMGRIWRRADIERYRDTQLASSQP